MVLSVAVIVPKAAILPPEQVYKLDTVGVANP